jgi:2-methylcitrate dehydratase PrpD
VPEAPSRVTARLTELLDGIRYDTLSPAARHAAKRVLLDATGVMLGASGVARETDAFVALARAMGPGPCSILGTGLSANPALAALANGAMAHALDYEDAFDLAPGHPNASLVPALLALAQWQGGVDGRRFIAALVAGCELACRMGLALGRKMEAGGWYPPPILAGYGAALGACHLLNLGPQRMSDALSLTLCQVTMPGEIKHSARTVIRAVREAFPAQAAVQSALLAEQELAGFEQPLEGIGGFYALFAGGSFDPEILLAPLDGSMWIEDLTFKPWPSCRGTHPFIQMAHELRERHGLDQADIAAVSVGVGPMQRMLVEPLERKRAPAVAIDAKFSIPFCVASVLAGRAIDLEAFAERRLRDPAVRSLADKVRFDQPPGSESWRGDAGTLTLELTDGRTLEASLIQARGAPKDPLSDGDLIDKFVDCSSRAARPLRAGHARAFVEQILAIEECPDVGDLFAARAID